MSRAELTGKEINNLVFLSYSHSDIHRNSHWNIKCYCGNIFTTNARNIKTGDTKSCGCLKNKHNSCETPEYNIWCLMKRRCYNINCLEYDNYGGRGISVCDAWLTDFNVFLKDMGQRPSSKHSIDRINNNGNYCPENCKWSTGKQQCRNKRNNVLLTYNNETKTLTEWAEYLNINYRTLKNRINRGWSHEEALTTPIRKWPSQL